MGQGLVRLALRADRILARVDSGEIPADPPAGANPEVLPPGSYVSREVIDGLRWHVCIDAQQACDGPLSVDTPVDWPDLTISVQGTQVILEAELQICPISRHFPPVVDLALNGIFQTTVPPSLHVADATWIVSLAQTPQRLRLGGWHHGRFLLLAETT